MELGRLSNAEAGPFALKCELLQLGETIGQARE